MIRKWVWNLIIVEGAKSLKVDTSPTVFINCRGKVSVSWLLPYECRHFKPDLACKNNKKTPDNNNDILLIYKSIVSEQSQTTQWFKFCVEKWGHRKQLQIREFKTKTEQIYLAWTLCFYPKFASKTGCSRYVVKMLKCDNSLKSYKVYFFLLFRKIFNGMQFIFWAFTC